MSPDYIPYCEQPLRTDRSDFAEMMMNGPENIDEILKAVL